MARILFYWGSFSHCTQFLRRELDDMKKLFLIVFTLTYVILRMNETAYTAPIGVNLLDNPGFESDLIGWTTDNGAIRTASPLPHNGSKYLMGGNNGTANSYTYQTIDLLSKGFLESEIDSGSHSVFFGGWQAGWSTQTDRGKIEIILKDDSFSELDIKDLGWFYSNFTWTLKEGTTDLMAGTRYIDYGFYSKRYQGSNNDGYLDDAFLSLVPLPPALILFVSGLIGLFGSMRKFRKR
jgi:hypothetical protein